MQFWAVIIFDDENTVATIPSTWLLKADDGKDMCYWPAKTKNVTGYVKRREDPGDDWEQYDVTILGNNYASYEIAVKKALKAEETSELSSANEISKRKTFQNKKYAKTPIATLVSSDKSSDSEREDDDDTDDYPKQPKTKKSLVDSRSTKKKLENVVLLKSTGRDSCLFTDDENNKSRSDTPNRINLTPTSNCNKDPISVTPSTSFNRNTPMISHTNNSRFVSSHVNVDDKDFKRQVLTKLNIIIAKLNGHDEQFEQINNLLENLKPQHTEEDTYITGLELLPVTNDDSLALCEQFLSENTNLKKMAKELGRMGGNTVAEITRKFLYRIMSNEFAELYSWEGGKGKRKFVNITLSRLVIEAVRCNKRTHNACEDEIVQEVKRWLAKAKERIKNEKKKEMAPK